MDKVSGAKMIFRHYRIELNKYRWYVVAIVCLVPVAVLLINFMGAYVASEAIDKLTRTGTIPADRIWHEFGSYIVIFCVSILAGELVAWRLITYLIWRLEIKVGFNLYLKMFDFLAHQSAEFHADRFGGSLVSQASKFQSSYIRMADTLVFNFLPFMSTLLFTIVILATRVPWFAAIQLLITIAFISITILSYRKITVLNEASSEASNKLSGQIADMISNVLAVKSFSAEAHENERFFERNRVAAHAEGNVMRATMKRDFGFALSLSLLMIATFVSILYGQALAGISIGTMILMLTYSMNLFGQLWYINGLARSFNRIYGDALPMAKILATDVRIKDPLRPEPLRIQRGEVTFDDVSFHYSDASENVFQHLSFTVRAGQRVGLVGPSGSGKTTITNLLLRYAEVTDGQISIDAQPITAITQNDLRSAISYVPQQPLLFHRSIAENIAYGNPKASMRQIEQAAERANALEFIRKLPNQFETMVGERGVKLSGGQRQRIAIARAILKDAPLLVLDEATSALDSKSELLIQASLDELMKGRTSIVIAHRLSTIAKLDRILVMDNGSIIEDGTHKDLIRQDGAYAKLWSHQSGGFLE